MVRMEGRLTKTGRTKEFNMQFHNNNYRGDVQVPFSRRAKILQGTS
jgi:hypothetical protein